MLYPARRGWLIGAAVAVFVVASMVHPRADGGETGGWKPAPGPLLTRWAKEVSPENVHPEYPRPQMVREDWVNLNGLWEYAIRPKDAATPTQFDGPIMVPFAVRPGC